MQRINIAEPEFTFDAEDPPGFRAGMLRFGPSSAPSRPARASTCCRPARRSAPTTTSTARRSGCWCCDGTPSVRTPAGTEQLEPYGRRLLPARARGRAPAAQRLRRPGARADVVEVVIPDGLRLPRQRQDRRLDRRARSTTCWSSARAPSTTSTARRRSASDGDSPPVYDGGSRSTRITRCSVPVRLDDPRVRPRAAVERDDPLEPALRILVDDPRGPGAPVAAGLHAHPRLRPRCCARSSRGARAR